MGQYQTPLKTTTPASGLAGGAAYLTVAPAAGAFNNYNPGVPWPAVGILDIDTTAGDVTLTGLAAGSDKQMTVIGNKGANNLNLDNQNAGSLAVNRFRYAGDLQLVAGENVLVVYSKDVGRWLIL